ncbi:TPA: hypothetical protein DEG21_01150 [Patescibacteria group bacterium]|nr:hypothetical protein [Candidatus Gracilibacteria bacterium]HBY74510.1 hypothetical protein [Candidatus Gracilibacteria bacterium]
MSDSQKSQIFDKVSFSIYSLNKSRICSILSHEIDNLILSDTLYSASLRVSCMVLTKSRAIHSSFNSSVIFVSTAITIPNPASISTSTQDNGS